MNKKYGRKELSEEEIDNLVISQANNNAAWEAPIKVKKTGETKLALSKELAARAAFFANLHRETSLNDWLEQLRKLDNKQSFLNCAL